MSGIKRLANIELAKTKGKNAGADLANLVARIGGVKKK